MINCFIYKLQDERSEGSRLASTQLKSRNFIRNVSRDQRTDQSATSIQSLLNTNRATFLMTSHVRSALWTLLGCDMLILKVDKTLGRNLSVALLMMQR